MTLSQTQIDKEYTVTNIELNGNMKRRVFDIGLLPGCRVKKLFKSFLGEPAAYLICGAVIALRREDTDRIFVEVI